MSGGEVGEYVIHSRNPIRDLNVKMCTSTKGYTGDKYPGVHWLTAYC